MDVIEVIKNRRSVRWFTNKEVGYTDLLDLIEAGVCAPSAGNMQNQRFLIISDKDELRKLGKVRYSFPYPKGQNRHPYGLIGESSAAIVVFIDTSVHKVSKAEYNIWSKTWIQTAAATIQNMLLVATDKGLGSCWISAVPEMNNTRLLNGKTWREVFSAYAIPDTWAVYGIIVLGYPRKIKGRFAFGETRHQGRPVARKPIKFYLAEANT